MPAPTPDEDPVLAYAIGSAGLLFTGPWFTRPLPKKIPPTLLALPKDTLILGGHNGTTASTPVPALSTMLNHSSVLGPNPTSL